MWLLLSVACAPDPAPEKPAATDTADTGAPDTGAPDTGADDTGAPDSGADTSADTDTAVDTATDTALPECEPAPQELCNGVDDDGDGVIDEDAADALTWHTDADGDGYGAPATGLAACDAPAGTTDRAGDCDDGDAAVTDCPARLLAGGEAVRPFLAAGDVDGDGIADLAVQRADASFAFAAIPGAGDASLEDATLATAGNIELASAGDVDGDGLADIARVTRTFMGSGTDGFESWVVAARVHRGPLATSPDESLEIVDDRTVTEGDEPRAAVHLGGDLDGDGAPDVIFGTGSTASTAWVYITPGLTSGTRSIAQIDLVARSADRVGGPRTVDAADLDGDGLDDLVLGGAERLSVHGGPLVADAAAMPDREVGFRDDRFTYATARDFDGDGLPDLLFTGSDGTAIVVTERSVPYVQGEDCAWMTVAGTGAGDATAGDIDGDGRVDLLVGVADGGLHVFGAPHAGVFALADADRVLDEAGLGGHPVVLPDRDGDGAEDLAVTITDGITIFPSL